MTQLTDLVADVWPLIFRHLRERDLRNVRLVHPRLARLAQIPYYARRMPLGNSPRKRWYFFQQALKQGDFRLSRWLWDVTGEKLDFHRQLGYFCRQGATEQVRFLLSLEPILGCNWLHYLSLVILSGHLFLAQEIYATYQEEPKGLSYERDCFLNAAQGGNVEMLHWLKQTKLRCHSSASALFRVALRPGNLAMISELWPQLTSEQQRELPLGWALQTGDLSLVTWFWDQGLPPINPERWIDSACRSGSLPMVQWVLAHHPVNLQINRYFELACGSGNLELVEFLYSQNPQVDLFADRELFRSVCTGGHLPLAKWLWALFLTKKAERTQGKKFYLGPLGEDSPGLPGSKTYTLFEEVSARGHRAMAEWLYSYSVLGSRLCGETQRAFELSCHKGHLETAQWLYANCHPQLPSRRLWIHWPAVTIWLRSLPQR